MRQGFSTRRRRSGASLAVLVLLAALAASTTASAQTSGELRALGDHPQRHVRPISVTAQIEYCRELLAHREETATLARCFRYAALLLEEGIRLRRRAPARSAVFEQRLESGAKDIAARLAALTLDDETRLDQELRDLDQVIFSLRVELSRVASARGPRSRTRPSPR